ncbi:Hint domain-containing protein [Primorskyibacter sp. S187A]|uniref:Hint domain-containing protein n=1 Tax=Primorskyibacter sp. S187A TaxID=3415130 RepID=UPI003C7A3BDE
MPGTGELTYDTSADARTMAETIFGKGVTVVDATYTGDARSAGLYSNGDSIAPGATPGDEGVIFSTGRVEDYTNETGDRNTLDWTSTNTEGEDDNTDFNDAAGTRTYDASYIDVDFIPTGDVMTMQFVFGSEEYPEFVNSVFQDFVGVWINGKQVELSIGNGDIDPGNVNEADNTNLYVDNADGVVNSEMDGLTITMTLTIPVMRDEVNSIRIGVADVADASYDSNLLIKAGSVQTELVAQDDVETIRPDETTTIDVLGNDIVADGGFLKITHINGIAVDAGDSVTLATGQVITLNEDGTLDVEADSDEELFTFTYAIEDGLGNDDTGFVTLDSVPCFVAGTRIETALGPRRVEDLQPGDLILTRDEGHRPLRWIGQRTVQAEGAFAPVRIEANTLGAHDELWLSPEHRVLITDHTAELLFGEAEVLVAAKELVHRRGVSRQLGGDVTYVHLLMDRHQVIWSEGLATETFLPGPQVRDSFEQSVLDEICSLFPELDPETGAGYGPAARRLLRSYEAQALLQTAGVA